MNRRPRRLPIVPLVVILLLGCLALTLLYKPATSLFFRNLANISLNKELWRENRATSERQRVFAQIARLFESSWPNGHVSSSALLLDTPCAMLPTTAIALSHRWQRDWTNAAIWFRRAAEAEPYPPVQSSLLIPAFIDLNAEGNLVIDWEDTYWRFAGGSLSYPGNQASVTAPQDDGTITISYHNDLSRMDHFEYSWNGQLQLSYWRTAKLSIRIHPGTYFTIETLSEQERIRPIGYYEGTGQWEEFSFPIKGALLQQVLISLSEPSVEATTPVYAIDIKPVTLVLNEDAGTCAS
jgi:hypothetical protein